MSVWSMGMPGLARRFSHFVQFCSRVGFVHDYKTVSTSDLKKVMDNRERAHKLLKLKSGQSVDNDAYGALARFTGFVLCLRLESIFQVSMLREVISGIIHLAPLGPDEWLVFFSPALDGPIETIPRGTISEKNTKRVEICLRALGFAETRIAIISNFDFDKDELRRIEFDLIDGQFSLVRRLGLVSDNMGPFTPEENRRLEVQPPS